MNAADKTALTTIVRIAADGARQAGERVVAVEMPVAIEFNGLGYAVIMATPSDLEDFAYGFAVSERLIDSAQDVVDVSVHPMPDGIVLRVTLVADRVDRIADRVRHRISESSCGLCGIENLEQALRPLPRAAAADMPASAALFQALAALRAAQPLNQATGAVHAAALCDADGAIRLVREDVGRHSAFDKLIGAMLREDLSWANGFALLTSRCSYELVEKAVLARCPLLVTISAATSLAIKRAHDAGLALIILARTDAMLAEPVITPSRLS